jgi:hypothetical protein
MKRAVLLSMLIAVIGLGALTLSLPAAARLENTPAVFVYDPLVAMMMTQVQSNTVYAHTAQLTGETAAVIGGVPYTITTRNTNSGVPIQQGTQLVYEYLQQQGLAVSYHNWSGCGLSNRNVVGVLTGTLQPSEIVLVTAHLDDMPSSGRAPGADDNASGSVGVLLAADIMSQYHFSRTVRFVLFTGEEQGLCGSAAYANTVSAVGDNIVAVYNMDMIAWDALGGPTLRLHTRTTSNPGYVGDLAIAGVFTNVVNTYGLSGVLTPIIDPDGESASDHASFWNKGYPAILAIEDDASDFNAYYHTSNDTLSRLNLTYFTNYVKASVGTAAHLAQPIDDYATLQGMIVDASNSNPIGLAQVLATAGVTRTDTATANNTGQYALMLLEGNYQVTASAYGYLPQTVNGLSLQTDVTTTQDFSLTQATLYTVTGQVQDALTHHPLSATISIAGYPSSPIATDANGAYQIALAEGVAYTFHVQAKVPGYLALDRAVGPLTANRVEDFALQADLTTCLAPGYTLNGLREAFNTTSLPSGWGVINNVGTKGWSFNNLGGRSNLTGGTGNFAIADSDNAGSGVSMDTELRSPVLDLSTQAQVTLTFKTDFRIYSGGQAEVADVDVSTSGGVGPWTNVWRKTADYRGPKTEAVSLTAIAGGQANVMLRFHYYNAVYEYWWEVDDVQLGQCNPPTIGSAPIVWPAMAAQSGYLGTVVTYNLNISNTDSVSQTFDVLIDHNAWPTAASTPIGSVAAQSAQPFTVTVAIPGNAAAHSTDAATITLRAQSNPVLSATAILTTTALALPTVEIEPTMATQYGPSPAQLTYVLHLSHTDSLTHTFDVMLVGNGWAATPIGPAAPGSTQPLTVTILNPPYALGYTTSVANVTVQAQDNPALTATAVLTAVVTPRWDVSLAPATQAKASAIGTTVVYTLALINEGNVEDTYTLTLEGNQWPASLSLTKTLVTTIPRIAGYVNISAFVTIPATATTGMSDALRVTAHGTGVTAFSDLVTIAQRFYDVFLPLVRRD